MFEPMKFPASFTVVLAIFVSAGAVAAQQSDRNRGIDLYREGKYAESVGLLEKAVEANPKDRQAWLYLGGAYVNSGNDKLARKAFNKTDVSKSNDWNEYDSPLKMTDKPRPSYPRGVHSSQGSAKVTLAVEFLSSGTIGFVRSLDRGGQPDFERASKTAAQQIRFIPAVKDGKPVTVIQFIEYSFWVQ